MKVFVILLLLSLAQASQFLRTQNDGNMDGSKLQVMDSQHYQDVEPGAKEMDIVHEPAHKN
jgi:hypothetical protein